MDMDIDVKEVYNKTCLLRAVVGDKLDLTSTMLQELMKDIKKAVNEVHPYSITHGKKGWQTHVIDPSKSGRDPRKSITAQTEEELYLRLLDWYNMDIDNKKDLTLEDLYNEWMTYRKETASNPNTVKRDEQHYKRYFDQTTFFKKKVKDIKRPELKAFCVSVIKGETTIHTGKNSYTPNTHLTRKEWGNARTILNGMFEYALDCEYITVNPITGMKFEQTLFTSVKPKDKKTQIFNSEEEADLINWCIDRFKATNDTVNMIPVFCLYVGLRIGECVALEKTDWDGKHLTISKEEFKDRATNEVSVVSHTKTGRDRTIPLSDKAIRILNAIIKAGSEDSNWIFERNGVRISERAANYILEKYAKQSGNAIKSSHKLRKTCGSNLFKMGLNVKQCADYLGHSPEVFERNYLFDTDTEDELLEKLNA